ncbi:hypothetical protein [Streptomyces sp. NPDC058548]|uniref:hypothetical protein n=1 Tax=Streptomyces sp. NPDC058548 TaxID=3346545 RepID=UPI0036570C00
MGDDRLYDVGSFAEVRAGEDLVGEEQWGVCGQGGQERGQLPGRGDLTGLRP